MSKVFCRKELCDGVYFSSVRDEKFKSNRMTVCLVAPLERENATVNAIVPFLLRKGCREYPDFTLLNRKLSMLYGAALDADVTKYGSLQMMHVSIQSLDDRFAIAGEQMICESARLLCSVLLEPNLAPDGSFYQKDLELERQYLIDTIESELNDKRVYAVGKCRGLLFDGEAFGVKRYGYKDEAEALTSSAAAEAWRHLIKTSRIEIIFTGSGDPEKAAEIFGERLSKIEGRAPVEAEKPEIKAVAGELKRSDEIMDVAQGKLVMGYRMGAPKTKKEIDAARLMSAIYGATPFSKLFMNVREKMSLCYYCVAHYDKPTGVMVVDSGVEPDNRRAAEKEIGRQLELMAEGDFTDEEFDNTVLIMKNSLQTVGDMPEGLEGWYLTRILEGDSMTPEQDLADIRSLTRQDIIEAAKKVSLEAVYFLYGEGAPENE